MALLFLCSQILRKGFLFSLVVQEMNLICLLLAALQNQEPNLRQSPRSRFHSLFFLCGESRSGYGNYKSVSVTIMPFVDNAFEVHFFRTGFGIVRFVFFPSWIPPDIEGLFFRKTDRLPDQNERQGDFFPSANYFFLELSVGRFLRSVETSYKKAKTQKYL